jgi:hypothetical protein
MSRSKLIAGVAIVAIISILLRRRGDGAAESDN